MHAVEEDILLEVEESVQVVEDEDSIEVDEPVQVVDVSYTGGGMAVLAEVVIGDLDPLDVAPELMSVVMAGGGDGGRVVLVLLLSGIGTSEVDTGGGGRGEFIVLFSGGGF